MKKIFLILFIVIDLAAMAVASFMLYTYVQKKWPNIQLGFGKSDGAKTGAFTPYPAPPVPKPSPSSLIAPKPPSVLGGMTSTPQTGPETMTSRKMLFSYRNLKAKQVSIRADFTGWKAEPMVRNSNGVWTYSATLSPGEYAYCFTVDDKTFKDPANKRTKQIGRTFVSAIVVSALPSAKPSK